jgi:lysophospholipase L1-like esterase
MRKKIIVLTSAALLIFGAIIGYIIYMAKHLPDNNPEKILAGNMLNPSQKVIACLGDSITHGAISCNYVDELSRRLNTKGFLLVNAGINSHLAYNALLRVKEVAACKPDYITVLIGTNDVNATMSKENEKRYISDMNLPQRPDKEWYRSNLKKICTELKSLTKARIALISIPPIGENPLSTEYLRAKEYSRIIKDVAAEENITYLPLFEKLDELLKGKNTPSLHTFNETNKLIYYSAARHYLFGVHYNDISASNGFTIMTDFLHLNCTGAGMVADLIEDFVIK